MKMETRTGTILILFIVLMAIGMTVPLASATNEAAETAVTNSDPVISAVSFGPTAVDVNTNYQLNFTVTDANTLNDLTSIVVEVYYESETAEAIRKHYNFTWTEGEVLTNFVDSPATYWVSNTVPTSDGEAGAAFAYTLTFKLDKVAIPSADENTWTIKITAIDDSDASDTNTAETFDVNKYSEIAINESAINFGGLAPGTAIGKVDREVTMTANSNLSVKVTGADLVCAEITSGSDDTLAMTENLFNMNNLTEPAVGSGVNSVTSLTTSAIAVYTEIAETACALETNISGYSSAYTLDITFDGTSIPSPQEDGTYDNTWVIALDNTALTSAKY